MSKRLWTRIWTAALLAARLGADALLLLTDVDAVHLDHGMATERSVGSPTPEELRALRLPSGSMAPKADAAARFVTATPGQAAIGPLEDAALLLAGRAGTTVRSSHGRDPRPHPDGNPQRGEQSSLYGAAPASG